jgi:hypothetical protein
MNANQLLSEIINESCPTTTQSNVIIRKTGLFAHDATFKKHGPTTHGRPREKRLIVGNTEKARMIKASSNRQKTHQACSFCKMNGCRVSNCLVMKRLGAQPLEPLFVANTFTDALGDPSEHLVEIAQAEFLLSKIREQGLDHTSLPSETHHLVLKRCYFSSDNASTRARPSSWFGLSQQDNLSNPERMANIVEVISLAEGGSPIPGCRFLHVGAAISCMRKHASKTRRVFSKLKIQNKTILTKGGTIELVLISITISILCV